MCVCFWLHVYTSECSCVMAVILQCMCVMCAISVCVVPASVCVPVCVSQCICPNVCVSHVCRCVRWSLYVPVSVSTNWKRCPSWSVYYTSKLSFILEYARHSRQKGLMVAVPSLCLPLFLFVLFVAGCRSLTTLPLCGNN